MSEVQADATLGREHGRDDDVVPYPRHEKPPSTSEAMTSHAARRIVTTLSDAVDAGLQIRTAAMAMTMTPTMGAFHLAASMLA
jgi:hypothetical protein